MSEQASEELGKKEQERMAAFMADVRELVTKHDISGVFIVSTIGVVVNGEFGVVADATLGFEGSLPPVLRHGILEIFSKSGMELLDLEHSRLVEADPSCCSERENDRESDACRKVLH